MVAGRKLKLMVIIRNSNAMIGIGRLKLLSKISGLIRRVLSSIVTSLLCFGTRQVKKDDIYRHGDKVTLFVRNIYAWEYPDRATCVGIAAFRAKSMVIRIRATKKRRPNSRKC
ncbi:hypothetical protein MLD38_002023 [Melastoma candidum]|uniref:Uncharacterized protein n=1 Tax=Melastoma candidum TaxID=119954 RepID=A0ACB9SF73_9MYRT|nr:hypothetical protein MLD38_002023 [Melastoma candidum]